MLRHCRQPLVQQVLQAIVVRANLERAPPKIGTPMAHGLYQANELLLVRRELEVTSGEGPAEVGERPLTLVKHGAEPHPGGIAVDDERPCEVRHLEDGARRESLLQGLERRGGLVIPGERIATQ